MNKYGTERIIIVTVILEPAAVANTEYLQIQIRIKCDKIKGQKNVNS